MARSPHRLTLIAILVVLSAAQATAASVAAAPAATNAENGAKKRNARTLGLPSARKCVARDRLSFRVRAARGRRLRRARVIVTGPRGRRTGRARVVSRGKRGRVLRGKRLRGRVTLSRLPAGPFGVRIVAMTKRGRKLRARRTYRRCPGSPTRTAIPGCADDTHFPGGLHPGGEWRFFGRDQTNTRHQPRERKIGPQNVGTLGAVWTFSAVRAGGEGDFTGTPVVADGCVFAGSNRGWVFAMNADTGKLVWKMKVPRGGQVNGSLAVPGDGRVYAPVSSPPPTSDAGTCEGEAAKLCVGPYMIALDERDGKLLWQTAGLDEATGPDIYASPMVFDGTDNGKVDPVVFSGISGWGAESGGVTPGSSSQVRYAFDGSFVLIDATTGKLLKKTYTIKKDPKDDQAGCGIWSTPAIDAETGLAYVGTSNPFNPKTEHPNCNAILKIGVDRSRNDFGQILGGYQATREDYVSGYIPGYPCIGTGVSPTPSQDLGTCADMDLSVGASPNLFRDSSGRKLVGVGQKSGIYHTAEAGSMAKVWTQLLGFPTLIGGIVGSTAYDGRNIYGPNTAPGFTWSVKKDDGALRWMANHAPGYGNQVAVANGVVYQTDQSGVLNAYDAETGHQLLMKQIPAETQGGTAIARNTVYVAIGTTTQTDGKIVAMRPGGSAPEEEEPGGAPDGGGGGPDDPGQPGQGGAPATSTIVAGASNQYYTRVTPVSVSGTLNFLNLDSAQHDVTSKDSRPNGQPLFRSRLIGTGETTTVDGSDQLTPGRTYSFFCTVHAGMSGDVLATP